MIFGGGIFKTIIKNLAKSRGINPSEYLKITNYKSLPNNVKKIMSKAEYDKMKADRIALFENLVEMAKTRQRFLKNIEEGKKSPAAPIFEHLEQSFKSPVPHGVTDTQILQGEQLLKNLKTEGRPLNATGGRVPLAGGKKVPDPGYFMFQEPDEDRPSRYEYDPNDPEVMEEMERAKQKLIKRGIIERKIFSETDRIPTENYFLKAMQNPEVYFPTENTPEELEEFERNLRLKQEVKDGGRVPLAGGAIVKGLAALRKTILKKYKGKIDDKLLKQMLVDDDPQRIAEVMATIDEGLIMQGKGMGPETIIQTIKDSWKRKKQASGGLAGLLGE